MAALNVPGRRRVRAALVALALAVPAGALAADGAGAHAGHAMGRVDFPVSCAPASAAAFREAATLLHHMTYPQAREAFEALAAGDPGCAMAHWGVAMTLFQPLWPTRPDAAARARGWAAVQAARAAVPPTARERLFVEAAAAFFQDPGDDDYWGRIRRWADAQARLLAAFPQDPEARAFHALALLATAPSDRVDRANADQAAALLLQVHGDNPDHPGAMHYLVHANDIPGRERESLALTRRYEAIAPQNPHALHMPTHIHTRLGDWDAVVRGNLRAADAALRFPAGDAGQYVWDEFPHAVEYLVYAYLQQGADADAAAQLARLQGMSRLEPSFKTAFHLASTQARHALERRDWAAAAAIVPRANPALDWDRYPWPEAVSWFARGLGAVHTGQAEAAAEAERRLGDLEAATGRSGEALFARNIGVLRLGLAGWRAHVGGRPDQAVALLREAAALEAATPKHAVTPAPTLPARELLGDLLMAQRRPAEAAAAYAESTAAYPARFNSLLGAARAARALGDDAQARAQYRQLLAVAARGTRRELGEARTYAGASGRDPSARVGGD